MVYARALEGLFDHSVVGQSLYQRSDFLCLFAYICFTLIISKLALKIEDLEAPLLLLSLDLQYSKDLRRRRETLKR